VSKKGSAATRRGADLLTLHCSGHGIDLSYAAGTQDLATQPNRVRRLLQIMKLTFAAGKIWVDEKADRLHVRCDLVQ